MRLCFFLKEESKNHLEGNKEVRYKDTHLSCNGYPQAPYDVACDLLRAADDPNFIPEIQGPQHQSHGVGCNEEVTVDAGNERGRGREKFWLLWDKTYVIVAFMDIDICVKLESRG